MQSRLVSRCFALLLPWVLIGCGGEVAVDIADVDPSASAAADGDDDGDDDGDANTDGLDSGKFVVGGIGDEREYQADAREAIDDGFGRARWVWGNGGADLSWHNPLNWRIGSEPGPNSEVMIGMDGADAPRILPNHDAQCATIYVGPKADGTLVVQDGATLTTNGWLHLGFEPGATGLLQINASNISYVRVNGGVNVGVGGTGTVAVGGGTLDIRNTLYVPNPHHDGSGTVNITRGSVLAANLEVNANGQVRIGHSGVLVLSGDRSARVDGYIASGKLAPLDDFTLVVDFGITHTGNTTVRARRVTNDLSVSGFYFEDDGREIALAGLSDRSIPFMWETEQGFDWEVFLLEIAAAGYNYVRFNVTDFERIGVNDNPTWGAQFSNPRWAFERTGPGTAVDGRPRFDLTNIDEGYFTERIHGFLSLASELGIYVELTLFEDVASGDWETSLFNDINNINNINTSPSAVTTDLSNPTLLAIQTGFVDAVLQYTAGYGNVIFEIANESGGSSWVTHWINYIHNHRPGSIVSAGEQSSGFDPCNGPNDVYVKHRGGLPTGTYNNMDNVERHHDRMVELRQCNKPITHNEFFLEGYELNVVRWMLWGDFTAGGHANYLDFKYYRGWERDGVQHPSQTPPEPMILAGTQLTTFIEANGLNNRLTSFVPADNLGRIYPNADRVFTLAKTAGAKEFIAYALGDGNSAGNIKVFLPLDALNMTAVWLDPKTGAYTPASATQEEYDGAQRAAFGPYTIDQDVVLYVR